MERLGILVSNGFSEALAGTEPDILLDFTQAEVAVQNAKLALQRGIRPVIGTSGISVEDVGELSKIAVERNVGAMVVPNFSVGAVLMMEFARQAAYMFQNVEVVEMHHTGKKDAPSGTAMHTIKKLAQSGADFNRIDVDEKELLPGARGGQGAAGVRVHSLRLPGLISHQEVIFGGDGELLTIRHDSFNTNCFSKGILIAIRAVMGLNRLLVGLDGVLPLGRD
jgi:4-hydroxy-tetrahydrodipicolinate reductase